MNWFQIAVSIVIIGISVVTLAKLTYDVIIVNMIKKYKTHKHS